MSVHRVKIKVNVGRLCDIQQRHNSISSHFVQQTCPIGLYRIFLTTSLNTLLLAIAYLGVMAICKILHLQITQHVAEL